MAETLLLTARHGDMLDGLMARDAGLGPAALAHVLAANPGLAALGPVLPAGTIVTVPATAPTSAILPLINLWD